jgi:diketogulonate reductase-like aldo/keto reductase
VPIPGTPKLHRLEENLGAVNVELTENDLKQIDEVASKLWLVGARLPEAALKDARTLSAPFRWEPGGH